MQQIPEEKEIVLTLQPDEEFLRELDKICTENTRTNRILEELLENARSIASSEILEAEAESLE